MAVVAAIGLPAAAVNYTFTTDTSADFPSVANSTYFYNKADKLVRYKDSTGAILEIFSAAGGGGTSNPSVVGLSTIDGTIVTGTTVDTISTSLLIPANTFSGNGLLQFLSKNTRNVVGSAAATFRVYTNTSASLTGAILIATSGTSGTSFTFNQMIRTARINANTLTCINSTATNGSDYVTNAITTSATFVTSVDNYLLFSCQLVNAADTAYNEIAIATKYI
jgi:hypothetical protein